MRIVGCLATAAGRTLAGLAVLSMNAWAVLAIYYSNLPGPGWRTAGAVAFAAGAIVLCLFVRPWRRALLVFLAAFAALVAWWLAIPPSNERDWQPEVAVLPYAEIQGDRVSLRNIRNNEYRTETDYTVRHYDKSFDLSQLRTLDLFLVYWGSPAIAHTITGSATIRPGTTPLPTTAPRPSAATPSPTPRGPDGTGSCCSTATWTNWRMSAVRSTKACRFQSSRPGAISTRAPRRWATIRISPCESGRGCQVCAAPCDRRRPLSALIRHSGTPWVLRNPHRHGNDEGRYACTRVRG